MSNFKCKRCDASMSYCGNEYTYTIMDGICMVCSEHVHRRGFFLLGNNRTRRAGEKTTPQPTGLRRRYADFVEDNPIARDFEKLACNEARCGNPDECNHARAIIRNMFNESRTPAKTEVAA